MWDLHELADRYGVIAIDQITDDMAALIESSSDSAIARARLDAYLTFNTILGPLPSWDETMPFYDQSPRSNKGVSAVSILPSTDRSVPTVEACPPASPVVTDVPVDNSLVNSNMLPDLLTAILALPEFLACTDCEQRHLFCWATEVIATIYCERGINADLPQEIKDLSEETISHLGATGGVALAAMTRIILSGNVGPTRSSSTKQPQESHISQFFLDLPDSEPCQKIECSTNSSHYTATSLLNRWTSFRSFQSLAPNVRRNAMGWAMDLMGNAFSTRYRYDFDRLRDESFWETWKDAMGSTYKSDIDVGGGPFSHALLDFLMLLAEAGFYLDGEIAKGARLAHQEVQAA